jgi:8-oxo-dGTP diphosphatase
MPPAPAFCPTCGEPLLEREIEGRTRRYCPNCERPIYRNPRPAAGVLVVRDDPRSVLLIRRSRPPGPGTWSVPAGFLEWDEPPRRGAVRELREETGVAVEADAPTLFDTRIVPGADGGYVIVLVYTVPASAATGTPAADSDAQAAAYFSASDLEDAPLEPGYRPLFERALAEVGDGSRSETN